MFLHPQWRNPLLPNVKLGVGTSVNLFELIPLKAFRLVIQHVQALIRVTPAHLLFQHRTSQLTGRLVHIAQH